MTGCVICCNCCYKFKMLIPITYCHLSLAYSLFTMNYFLTSIYKNCYAAMNQQDAFSRPRTSGCLLYNTIILRHTGTELSLLWRLLWNELPVIIRSVSDINIFKSKLKTHRFKQAYNL